ncbi:MAG: tRNA1(Val) (adenine(37)-N6)-methyltransferase [Desulfitobacteriaceae bacterium]|nr:tRNA1(Val) (adenine(37)-N6)-methyltransferase [Desulfitobacteriaceae bacterium]MDD4752544.1 tRNA1(Val) (adenine(37)-N6)-methyltransferase [Desulfitobacteriaceae bacterium]
MLKGKERVDSLLWRGLKIIQNPEWFCFSLDAVLLAYFATVRPGDRVVDLGTGTGVIPLLLVARTRKVRITGLEIKAEIIDMARRTISLNGLTEFISLVQGDIKNSTAILGLGQYDLVTSNPPYARASTGRISMSPIKAAAKAEILCNLEDVVREGTGLLNAEGRLALIHRPSRLAEIIFYMKQYGIEPKKMRFIYSRPEKEPNLVLVEGIKNGKKDLVVYPPLYVYDLSGSYSKEMTEIFSGSFLPKKW